MWKATAGQSVKIAPSDEVDDWETDPDFEVPAPTFAYSISAHFILFKFSLINLFFSSRMMCQRRSSAGGPRRWRAQDIRNTSSEEQTEYNKMQAGYFQYVSSFLSMSVPVSTSYVRRCPQNTPP